MESNDDAPPRDGDAPDSGASLHSDSDAQAETTDAPEAPGFVHSVGSDERDDGPAPSTSVGLWGPSGHGKTNFALSITSDPGYAPCLYMDSDGGHPAIRGYEAADLMVVRSAKTFPDVMKLIGEVERGRVRNRAGQLVRSVVVDAVTKILAAETGRLGLQTLEAKDQAIKLKQPWNVLLGHLTSLFLDRKLTCVHIAHSKDYTVKVGDSTVDLIKPDMYKSLAQPWMSTLRHLWRMTRTRGKNGPAFPIFMLRSEPEGVYGTPTHVQWMKTSNIAFAQWLAGQSGKREWYQWDTGTLPVDQHPTLAMFLRTCDDLAIEQGRVAATNPAALRAMAALDAALAAA